MNVKTTIALLALLVAIGAYFFFIEMDAPVPDPAGRNSSDTPIKGLPLLPEDFASPTEGATLTLERDGQTAVYELTDDGWYQTQPVRVAMNAGSMERLVGDVLQLRYTQTLTPGQGDAPTLEQAKLDPPLATITYAAGDDEATVRVGRKMLGGFAYAALDDESTIRVVGDRLYNGLIEADTKQWRKRTLDAPPVAQVDRLVIEGGGESVTLHRVDGRWALDEGGTQRADADAVETLVSAIGAVSIDKFHADALAEEKLSLYGLDRPTRVVTLHDAANDTTSTLTLGGPTDLAGESIFATWQTGDAAGAPVVFSVQRSAVESLEVDSESLREPKLLETNALAVRQITVERDGLPTIRLERDTEGLKFIGFTDSAQEATDEPAYDADRDAATEMISDITGFTANAFAPGYEPQGEPVATVELLRRGTGRETANVYRDGERFVAVRNDEPVGYVLTEAQIERLNTPRLALRERAVARVPADAIERLTLTLADGSQSFVREGDALVPEDGRDVEPGRIGALTAALDPLYAESWVIDGEADAGPSSAVTLEVTTPTGSLTLAADPVTRRATFTGIDAAFVLPEATVELFIGGLDDRPLVTFAAEDIDSIRLEQDGKHFTMRHQADGTIIADKAEHLPTLDQEMSAKLFDAVAGLQIDDAAEEPDRVNDEKQTVLSLTITGSDGSAQALEIWTQGDRMYARPGDGAVVTLTEESAAALAFLFEQAQASP